MPKPSVATTHPTPPPTVQPGWPIAEQTRCQHLKNDLLLSLLATVDRFSKRHAYRAALRP